VYLYTCGLLDSHQLRIWRTSKCPCPSRKISVKKEAQRGEDRGVRFIW